MSIVKTQSTKTRKEEPDMYLLIRKGGIGERAEPIYYRQVIAHLYVMPRGHNIVRPAGPAAPTGRRMPSVLRTGQGASPLRCLATAIPDHIHHINHNGKEITAV